MGEITLKPKNHRMQVPSSTSNDNVVIIDTKKKQSSACDRLLYGREEAARQLSLSPRSLDYYVASKQIQTRRKGSRVLIPHSELVRFAATNHYGPIAS
jgi:hypothetical protein